jgi:hypothetical protein
VPCTQGSGILQLPGAPIPTSIVQNTFGTPIGTSTVSPTPIPSATPTVTPTFIVGATITPTVTATATTVPLTPRWLGGPPPSGPQQCPDPKNWLLLYWGGNTTPIASSANACPTADLFWVNRTGRWMGFARVAVSASDSWESLPGEAHFAHGQ